LSFAIFLVLAVTDWRLRRWRLCFLTLMTATPFYLSTFHYIEDLRHTTVEVKEEGFSGQFNLSKVNLGFANLGLVNLG